MSSTAVTQADQSTFGKEVLGIKGLPVLVDFWAPWCGPCHMQDPILQELAAEVGGKAKIVKVNGDENPDLCQQYNVMGIPALKIFKDGELVGERVGVHSKKQLMELIESHS